MEGLSVREGTKEDRGSLEELFREELKFHENLQPEIFKIPKVLVSEKWLESILNDNETFLMVAEFKGRLVGAILYKIVQKQEDTILRKRRYGYIEEMIVKESFRGKGIGKKLLDRAIGDFKERDIREIEVDVWENNEIGKSFYEGLGFQTVRRRMKKKML